MTTRATCKTKKKRECRFDAEITNLGRAATSVAFSRGRYWKKYSFVVKKYSCTSSLGGPIAPARSASAVAAAAVLRARARLDPLPFPPPTSCTRLPAAFEPTNDRVGIPSATSRDQYLSRRAMNTSGSIRCTIRDASRRDAWIRCTSRIRPVHGMHPAWSS